MELVLRAARVKAEWIKTPTPEDIQRSDHERLLATLLEPVVAEEGDAELVQRLLAERSPQQIATALVRAHRATMPAAEDIVDSGAGHPSPRGPSGRRPVLKDAVWFRMAVGRRQNADPRWILPLLCRRGHVTKDVIGAIRIAAAETTFEIPRAAAGRFMQAVKRTATGRDGDGAVLIEPLPEQARGAKAGRP